MMKKKKKEPIFEPNENDVLKGRGKGPQDHTGNIRFREFVNDYKFDYITAGRNSKRPYCEKIYNKVGSQNPPGRFLVKTDINVEIWYEMDKEDALKKIQQALRENGASMKAAIETKDVDEVNE